MKQERKDYQHHLTRAEIKALAWQQISEQGVAALSLRAIATQMGLTSPALYRYYKNRDELVTDLIVDAFDSLAQALEKELNSLPEQAYAQRIWATAIAYRQWAIQYSQRYLLIFGTPIPGYHAPREITLPAAGRAYNALVQVLNDAYQAGLFDMKDIEAFISSKLRAGLHLWQQSFYPDIPETVLVLSLVCWSRIHGLVSLEIIGQTSSFMNASDDLYTFELAWLFQKLGIDIPTNKEK